MIGLLGRPGLFPEGFCFGTINGKTNWWFRSLIRKDDIIMTEYPFLQSLHVYLQSQTLYPTYYTRH